MEEEQETREEGAEDPDEDQLGKRHIGQEHKEMLRGGSEPGLRRIREGESITNLHGTGCTPYRRAALGQTTELRRRSNSWSTLPLRWKLPHYVPSSLSSRRRKATLLRTRKQKHRRRTTALLRYPPRESIVRWKGGALSGKNQKISMNRHWRPSALPSSDRPKWGKEQQAFRNLLCCEAPLETYREPASPGQKNRSSPCLYFGEAGR